MDNKKGRMPWYLRMFFNIIIVGGLIFAVKLAFEKGFTSSYDIVVEQSNKQSDSNIREVKIKVDRGATTEDVANAVYEGGLTTNKLWFKVQSKLLKFDGKYKEGVYSLNTTMTDKKIMEALSAVQTAENDNIRVTIPEGFNIMQIAGRLEELELVTKEEFLSAVNDNNYDYEFLEGISNMKKNKLEGYLFPDTYFFPENVTAQEIVIRMLNRFEEITNNYKQELIDSPYTFDQVITIASIIEQEAKLEEERDMISGVMYNRLEDDMKLQMCSTVQYALEKKTANLSYADLEVESPYNTYKYSGLPIGAICSPGEASIRAAFLPEEHDFYFFVLSDTEIGSHAFSTTAEEHNSNKAKYKQSVDKNFHE